MANCTAAWQPLGKTLQQGAQHRITILASPRRCIMSSERPPTLDATAAERWLQRPRQESAWLHEEVARRMVDRLGWIRLQPASWMHWEPLLGGRQAHAALRARYPRASALVGGHEVSQDWAMLAPRRPWWHPLAWRQSAPAQPDPKGVEMLWANMALHMAADPQALIERWHQQLAVGGFLMFSCLGPDSLHELRTLYAALGWPPPAHEFTDMHDWGDMLVQAGFAEPVMDMERIELSFATPERLLQELRGLGRNLHPGRFPALRSRRWLSSLHQALLQLPRTDEGQLKLTFEVIYGHAFKPAPRFAMKEQTVLPLEQLRESLRRDKPDPSR